MEKPQFSFVLPCYNEGENLPAMYGRLVAAGEQLKAGFEIIFVDDGSSDDTEQVLSRLADEDKRVIPIHFSRNFGHMAALSAGLEASQGTEAIICLDADGQHPPELIPDMVRRWREGADIVQSIRKVSADTTFFKRVTSRMFYALLNSMSDLELPDGAADFRLMDRQVVDALIELPERSRFMRGLVHWLGFRREYFEYEAPPRMKGVTKYSATKMLAFALNGITSFSHKPLRATLFLGLMILAAAAVYALYVLFVFFSGGFIVPGWPSLILVMMILGGFQLLMIGILGEYVGRIYTEVKARPTFVQRKPRRKMSDPSPR